MDRHLLGGLVLGGLPVAIGVVFLLGALRGRRERLATGPTYNAAGGIVYTIAQSGCAVVLILLGLIIGSLIFRGGAPH